jgi:hypothetical protein
MGADHVFQTRERPAATGRLDRTHNTSGRDITTDPFERVLARLEGVQRHGENSARAYSPLGRGTSRSLSISRGPNGTVLMHEFSGDSTQDVLAAIGLTVGDLFPLRDLRTMTPAERHQLRQSALIPRWRCALDVLSHEATVLMIAASKLSDGDALTVDELTRMRVSALKVFDCCEVFNAR